MRPETTATTRPDPEAAAVPATAPLYVDFLCYRLNPAFRRLEPSARQRGVQEFLEVARQAQQPLQLRWHLSAGLRAEVDIVIWAFAEDIACFQMFVADLARTGLGPYLELTYAFLALRKPSQYTSHHATAFEAGLPPKKYLFLYPFVKSREWYLLPFAERKRMMEQHAAVGAQYPSVHLNTTYAFGLGDQDFVLAFEADEPAEFEALVQQLRESEASRYTVRDTPMLVAAFAPVDEVIRGLGL